MQFLQFIWSTIQGLLLVPMLGVWAAPGTGFLAHHINDYISNDMVYVVVLAIFSLFYFITFEDDAMESWTYEGATDINGIPVRVYC